MNTNGQRWANAKRKRDLNWWLARKAVLLGQADWLSSDDSLEPVSAMPSWIAAELLGVSRPRIKQLLDAGILQRGNCNSAQRVGHGSGTMAGVTELSVWRRLGITEKLPQEIPEGEGEFFCDTTELNERVEKDRLRQERKRRAVGIPARSQSFIKSIQDEIQSFNLRRSG